MNYPKINCPKCETLQELDEDTEFCDQCGTRLRAAPSNLDMRHSQGSQHDIVSQFKSDFGIFSGTGIFFGILSFFFFPIIFGPLGVILGAVGSSKSEKGAEWTIVVSAVCMVASMMLGCLTVQSLLR